MPSFRPPADRIPGPLSPQFLMGAGGLPPSLWNHLDPSQQQQLAQHLAELIRRMRQERPDLEGRDHEQP